MSYTPKVGDQVVITAPAFPDRNPAGTRAEVTLVGTGGQAGLIGIVTRDGRRPIVWTHEVSPAD
ncbi:hypothetical protein ACWCXH_14385 [Kitasatospora sp. NPDC001660]